MKKLSDSELYDIWYDLMGLQRDMSLVDFQASGNNCKLMDVESEMRRRGRVVRAA